MRAELISLAFCRTSDGYALAVGWSLGYSVWSVYGRLGSWSVAGSLADGYGVEGEKSDAFEDHFMNGVRSLVSWPFSVALEHWLKRCPQ